MGRWENGVVERLFPFTAATLGTAVVAYSKAAVGSTVASAWKV
jgi:hypothetical protein